MESLLGGAELKIDGQRAGGPCELIYSRTERHKGAVTVSCVCLAVVEDVSIAWVRGHRAELFKELMQQL